MGRVDPHLPSRHGFAASGEIDGNLVAGDPAALFAVTVRALGVGLAATGLYVVTPGHPAGFGIDQVNALAVSGS